MEILTSPFVDYKHRFALALFAFFIVSELTFLNLDIVLLCQPTQGLGIGNLLMLHQEVDGIATLATGKAFANLTGWRHHKRRCLVIVERTKSLVVNPRLAQVNKLAYDIYDVDGIHNLIDCSTVYHACKVTEK